MSTFETGATLPEQTYTVTRADLVRYAGASGDLNPIHWSDRVATSVGLPGVIAHGMYTLALAARALDTWAGGPGRVRRARLQVHQARRGARRRRTASRSSVRGTVKNVTDEGVQVALEVTCGGREGARHAEGSPGCLTCPALHHPAARRSRPRARARDHRGRAAGRRTSRGRRRHAGAARSPAAATWSSPTTASTAPSCTSRPAASTALGGPVRRGGRHRRRGRALGRVRGARRRRGLGRRRGALGHPRQRRRDPGAERRRLRPGGRRHRRLGALLGPRGPGAAHVRRRRLRLRLPHQPVQAGPGPARRARRDLPAPARRPVRTGALRRAGPHPRRRGGRPGAADRGARGGPRRCAAARAWCSTTATTTPGAPGRSSPTRSSSRARPAARGRAALGAAGRHREDQRRLADRARRVRARATATTGSSLSTKHTLALTNRGSASTEDLLALAGEVRRGVHAASGSGWSTSRPWSAARCPADALQVTSTSGAADRADHARGRRAPPATSSPRPSRIVPMMPRM